MRPGPQSQFLSLVHKLNKHIVVKIFLHILFIFMKNTMLKGAVFLHFLWLLLRSLWEVDFFEIKFTLRKNNYMQIYKSLETRTTKFTKMNPSYKKKWLHLLNFTLNEETLNYLSWQLSDLSALSCNTKEEILKCQ